MKPYFDSNLENVPSDICLSSKEYLSEHLSIVDPKEYEVNQKLYLEHYQLFNFSPLALN